MNGVFMDGGGHDHIGHGFQTTGTDSSQSSFGHIHGHDHGGVTPTHGNDGGFLTSLLGFNDHGHSFLAHLLGLDHDHGHAAHHGEGASPGQHPSQTPIWSMAMGSIKPSNLLHGIQLTTNFWFLVMFLSFTSWLFVLYWVRHHEPVADAVLGDGAAHSATTDFDRKMIGNCRGAIPLGTNAGQGIYVPLPNGAKTPALTAANTAAPQTPPTFGVQNPALPIGAQPAIPASNYSALMAPAANYTSSTPFGMSSQSPVCAFGSPVAQPAAQPPAGAFPQGQTFSSQPVQSGPILSVADGSRLRTIINR